MFEGGEIDEGYSKPAIVYVKGLYQNFYSGDPDLILEEEEKSVFSKELTEKTQNID